MVKLVEAPDQLSGTGAHQAEPNPFSANLEIHFPDLALPTFQWLQFRFHAMKQDFHGLTSRIIKCFFHPPNMENLDMSALHLCFCSFLLYLFGSFGLLFLVMSMDFVGCWLTVHASTTQRPWGDARDDQNPWVLEQVTTETPGKRSWSGISKEGISALHCNAFGCFRWSMSHGSRASAHQVVIWTPSECFECLNASRLLFQCLVAVQWHVFLKMFEAVAPPSSSI